MSKSTPEPVMTETTRRLARLVRTYRQRAQQAHGREWSHRLAYKHLLQRLCAATGVRFSHPPSWEYDQVADQIVAAALRARADLAERRVVNEEQFKELTNAIHAAVKDADLDCGGICGRIAQGAIKAGWRP